MIARFMFFYKPGVTRSRSTSGPVQRGRPRGPRLWPRPLRSRHQAVLVRSLFKSSQPGAEAEAEVWTGSEMPGPPGPLHSRQRAIRLMGSRQLQIQTQIQRQHSQSSLRERVLSGHLLYDGLAALGRRPQEHSLHQRPSVAPDPGREVVTSHRCLAGQQQQQP